MPREVKVKTLIFTCWSFLLLVPSFIRAEEDPTLFGRVGKRYGPKPNSLTFTLLSGVYLRGENQNFNTNAVRLRRMWDYGVRLGWAFNRVFELEGGLVFSPTRNGVLSQNVYSYTLNAVVQFPVWDRVVPYLTAGGGGLSIDTEGLNRNNKLAVNYGGGIKFFIFRNLALRPDARALTSFKDTHTAILGSLNLTYYVSRAPKAVKAPEEKPAPPPPPPPVPTPTPTPTPTPEPTPKLPGDRDQDGIPDLQDLCPDQPEVYNGYQDEDGCPDHELQEFSGRIEGIHFAAGSTIIEEESFSVLNRAAEVFKKYPKLRIQIEGHTDSDGSKKLNDRLSKKRAESVRHYLIHQEVDPKRLEFIGYGFSRPIASNTTTTGKAQNRRIEFKLLNPEVVSGFKSEPSPGEEMGELTGPVEGIRFASGASIIERASYPKLNQLVTILKKYPGVRIRIEGHTDSTGSAWKNERLSKERAESVRQYLISKNINPERMEIKGFGETQPIVSNQTSEGRATNRRIEFKILNLKKKVKEK